MKNLFLAFALLLVAFTAFADMGPVGRSVTLDNLGAVQSGAVEKWYINVKNVKGSSVADGSVMVMDLTEDDGYSVTTTTTAGQVPVCIMAKKDGSACADDAVCRCQTWGLNAGVLYDVTNDTASAGDQVFLSEDSAGYVESEALGTIAASDVAIGIFMDDLTASGDAEVFIKLR